MKINTNVAGILEKDAVNIDNKTESIVPKNELSIESSLETVMPKDVKELNVLVAQNIVERLWF